MYNPQDTVENNLIKGTGPHVPDNMAEAQTMRYQVMSVLNACPHHVAADFRNISAGVKRWVRRLKARGTDKDHSDFMVSKFQGHMENGLFNVPAADVLDIYDRILQWGSLLDRKRNELRNYFPFPSSGATIPTTALNTTTGPSVYKQSTKQGQRTPKTASTRSPTTGTPANPAYPTCTYCGKVHQPGCGLTSHPDANNNTTIPWSESVNGKAITRLKGPGDSLDIKNRYDTTTGQLVPLDNDTLSKKRKKAYRLRKDLITRLEVRPSTFIT